MASEFNPDGLSEEEIREIIMANVQPMAVPGPPGKGALAKLANKKGIHTMKEQAKRLRELQAKGKIDPKEEGAAFVEWLSKPLGK